MNNLIKPLFLGMSNDRKTRLLSLIAHNLTICARAASFPEVSDALAREKLLRVNEILHLVTGHVAHMIKGSRDRYPDDVFMDIVLESIEIYCCESDFIQAFEWANTASSDTM